MLLASLAVKYRPKTWEEVTEQSVTTEILRALCESGDLQNRNFLLTGPAGTGKAQPMYSKVLTPDGYICMEDIKVGTKVFTHKGSVAEVSAVYPQGERPIYRIVLDDQTFFDVADNHLNLVEVDGRMGPFGILPVKGTKVMTTLQLIRFLKHGTASIPVAAACGSSSGGVIVDPWLVGFLFTSLRFHLNTWYIELPKEPGPIKLQTICNYLGRFLETPVTLRSVYTQVDANGYEIEVAAGSPSYVLYSDNVDTISGTLHRMEEGGYTISRTNFRNFLNGTGGDIILRRYPDLASKGIRKLTPTEYTVWLLGKRLGLPLLADPACIQVIPSFYLFNSVEKMKELFCGIDFAAAHEEKRGATSFQLRFPAKALSTSSQFVADVADLIRRIGGGARQRGSLQMECWWSWVSDTPRRYIQSIELIGTMPCQCIMVDHPDHTYLTDNCTPTHNTTTGRIMANVLNDGKGSPIEIDAASNNGVDSVRELIQQASTFPIGCKYKTFICDECFEGSTLVSTPEGDVRIDEIQEGDTIYTLTGVSSVHKVIKNHVDVHRLVLVVTPNEEILTTQDHLFMTSHGWIRAIDLANGDHLLPQPLVERAIRSSTLKFPDKFESHVVYQYLRHLTHPLFKSEPVMTPSGEDSRAGWCYVDCEPDAVGQCVHDTQFGLRQNQVLGVFPYTCAYGRVRIDSATKSSRKVGRVTMYDLEVSGHPSYFAGGYLVHNCHAFSNAAWQALLKVLEEGPARSVFIFATTNPEKIPATIISRVQQFPLSKISLGGIHDRMKYVIEQENLEGAGITYTEDALNYLAKLANGGMRDALTMLEKTLTYSKDITSQSLTASLSLPNYETYFELLQAYARKDNTTIARIVDTVYNSGVNFVKWFEQFHSFVINVVKYILLQDINLTMIPSHYQDKISKYGPAHSTVCLKLANRLVQLNAELKTTSYLQEFALTYLCSVPKKAG